MSEPIMSPWPLGFYAPGLYMRVCAKCELKFEGDKRAEHCLECAVLRLKEDANAAGALLAERDRLRAENERLREAHRENNRLLGLVAHDLTGRVEGGKVAAIYTAINNALAALAEGGRDE